MRKIFNKKYLSPDDWGIGVNPKGELMTGGCSTVELASLYGTPLHVVNERRLDSTAKRFLNAFLYNYPGKSSVHFAFKCNSVPGIVNILKNAGMKAEIVNDYELRLALQLGFPGSDIVVNGPFKPDSFISLCIEQGVRYIVVDSVDELSRIHEISKSLNLIATVLLRINPNYIPKGMNQGSATGSRKGCAFGLDLKGSDCSEAFEILMNSKHLLFHGFHFHIGSGIHRPADYRKALWQLAPILKLASEHGFTVRTLDIGGGFASCHTREMTTREMLLYQGWGHLSPSWNNMGKSIYADFALEISTGIKTLFGLQELPEIIIEPGRCITSSNQLLLLKVHRIKERPGIHKWLITDGGIGTVTMPTFYEYHEIFLCNDPNRPRTEKVTITGPVCFAADIVYRNKKMPVVHPQEVLAIMDSGAYFTAWESSFGFPHPAIATVANGKHHLIRRRENFDDMVARDIFR
jgi:diaminopimelate decarboxylase